MTQNLRQAVTVANLRYLLDIRCALTYPAPMPTREHTLTELLRNPRAVVADLDGFDVVVRRRDGEDFVIHSLARHRDETAAIGLLATLLHTAGPLPPQADGALAEQLPWVRFLPPAEQDAFAAELLVTIAAAASLGTFAPVSALVEQWRHTAAVWADPGLLRALSLPIEVLDGRPVPEPPAR